MLLRSLVFLISTDNAPILLFFRRESKGDVGLGAWSRETAEKEVIWDLFSSSHWDRVEL